MPITKSAKRALRKSYKNRKHNQGLKNNLKASIKNALVLINKKDKQAGSASSKTISLIDKAAKRKIISKQRAGRLKSRISKELNSNKIKPEKRVVSVTKSTSKPKKQKNTKKAIKVKPKKKVVKKTKKKIAEK